MYDIHAMISQLQGFSSTVTPTLSIASIKDQVTIRQWQDESKILLKWQLLKILRGILDLTYVKKKKMLDWPSGFMWYGKRKLALGHLIQTSRPRPRTENYLASAAHFIQTSTEIWHYSQKSHTLVWVTTAHRSSRSISVSCFWPILMTIMLYAAILQSSRNSNSQLLKMSEQAKFYKKWQIMNY